jgi:hypothetical protein
MLKMAKEYGRKEDYIDSDNIDIDDNIDSYRLDVSSKITTTA